MTTDNERPKRERTSRARTSIRLEGGGEAAAVAAEAVDSARAAALLAARRAETLLPAVRPAEVRDVEVEVSHSSGGLDAEVSVTAYGREPLDGRALLAVDVLAANLAEASGEARSAVIGPSKVVESRGGGDGLCYDFSPPVRAAVVTVSDAVENGEKDGRAGEIVADAVEEMAEHGVELVDRRVVSADPSTVESTLDRWIDELELLMTVGGTGLTHTDATVDVVEPRLDREIPGLMEGVRAHGRSRTPLAFMSRGVAGLIGGTLVVTLPGSRSGAAESVEALFPQLLHVVRTRRRSRDQLVRTEEET